jgi:hypothetical protein
MPGPGTGQRPGRSETLTYNVTAKYVIEMFFAGLHRGGGS